MNTGDLITIISYQPENIWRHANPWRFILHFAEYKDLLWQFTVREVQVRYRESFLGILWALITPLLRLVVYTFVFSVIFQRRWAGTKPEGFMEFGLILFTGIIAFSVFSESVSRAPMLIVGNPNYVKKVLFPLEILPVSTLGAALVHSLMSLTIVLVGLLTSSGKLYWTLLYLPLVYLPLIALTLGVSWLFASLGVFVPDVRNFVTVFVQILLFLSAIFYPLSAVPESFLPIFWLNPLAGIVENFRRVIIWGLPPDWPWLIGMTLVSILVMSGGYMWFMKIKWAFADVI